MFLGVLAEISMKAKMLKSRLKDDPDSVESVLEGVERLEAELFETVEVFSGSEDR